MFFVSILMGVVAYLYLIKKRKMYIENI